MTYRYVSIGMSWGGRSGIVSYLHDQCATHLNLTLGPDAIPFDGDVPPEAICPWCGMSFMEKEK